MKTVTPPLDIALIKEARGSDKTATLTEYPNEPPKNLVCAKLGSCDLQFPRQRKSLCISPVVSANMVLFWSPSRNLTG